MQSCVASHKYLPILQLHLYSSPSSLLFVKRQVLLKRKGYWLYRFSFNVFSTFDVDYYFLFNSIGLHQPSSSLPTSSIHLFIFVHVTIYNPSKRYRLWSIRNENYGHDKSRMDHEYRHDSDNDWMHQYIWNSSLWFVQIPWMGNVWNERHMFI